MAQPGEDSAHTAAAGAVMDSNLLAIVIAATVSTSIFIVAILILLLLLYHRDPTCCQFLCSCRFFRTPSHYDCPPPYFSSSQRLVGPQCGVSRLESAVDNPGVQGDELFCVGPPSSYQLPPWEQPRLPSYESVRKKDRQREIHQMIAKRFGLWGEPSEEMPPPYEHALRHPPAFSGTVISSETLDRCGVPDPFQAPLSYQTQRNTAVEWLNVRPSPRLMSRDTASLTQPAETSLLQHKDTTEALPDTRLEIFTRKRQNKSASEHHRVLSVTKSNAIQSEIRRLQRLCHLLYTNSDHHDEPCDWTHKLGEDRSMDKTAGGLREEH